MNRPLDGQGTLIGRLALVSLEMSRTQKLVILEAIAVLSEHDERKLSPLDLAQKYSTESGMGQHPLHTLYLWKGCVSMDETTDGYWDWVHGKVQNEDEPE